MKNLITKLTLFAAVAALTLTACASATSTTSNTNAQPAAGATAQQRPAPLATRVVATTSSVSVDGALALRSPTLSLGFDASSKVLTVNPKPGHTVKKGDVLATLDDTALKEAVADAELALQISQANIAIQNAPATKENLTAAQAQLSAAYASYSKTAAGNTATVIENARMSVDSAWLGYLSAQSQRDYACAGKDGAKTTQCQMGEASYGNAFESWVAARDTYLNLQKPVSQDTLTQAYASVVTAKNKVASLNEGVTAEQSQVDDATVSQAKATLEQAKSALSKATLVSPCDCVVLAVNVVAGETAPGNAFTLVDLAGLQFKSSNVVESDVASIKVNAPVTIRLKSYTDEFKGKVSAVLAQSSGTLSGAALYTVLIAVDPSQMILLPGMTGQAYISLQ